MKRIFLSVLSIALALGANATVYYFSPEGTGEQTGDSWDNAAAAEYLVSTIENAELNDTICLTEGTYLPTPNLYWDIPQGITLMGGFPASSTGTSLEYDYSKGGQSIFTADLDGDGIGDNTDYTFVYMGKSDVSDKDSHYAKDWVKTTFWGITFRDGNRDGGKYGGNMIFAKHIQADFHFCQFLNNVSHNVENGAITSWGSYIRCYDCIFRDNTTGDGGGGALCLRERNSSCDTLGKAEQQIGYFERCEFTDNKAYNPSTQEYGRYGGAMYMADNCGTAYFVNSTIKGSQSYDRGAGIRVSTACIAYFISTTWVANTCTGVAGGASGTSGGEAVSMGDRSQTYFINNIFVNSSADDGYLVTRAVIDFTNNDSKGTSAGFNIIGTINDNAGNIAGWPKTDILTTSATNIQTIENTFGTQRLSKMYGNHGGVSNTIAPLSTRGNSIAIADLKAAVAAWPLDDLAKDMDLTVDQRGYKRTATTIYGAYDVNGTAPQQPEGIEEVVANTTPNQVRKVMVDGQMIVIRNGIAYDVMGATR